MIHLFLTIINNEFIWNECKIILDDVDRFDLILTSLTFTNEFNGTDKFLEHLPHPRFINLVSFVEIFHLQVGQYIKKMNLPEIAPFDLDFSTTGGVILVLEQN